MNNRVHQQCPRACCLAPGGPLHASCFAPADCYKYLWLTGMFMRSLKQKPKGNPHVNAELKELFQAPAPAIAGELRAMLPEILAARVPAQTT